jgi:hypothetical protein
MASMASAPGPVSVEGLKGRSFSFYPAIRNIEHNEWTLDEENWSELQVSNRKSGHQLWIPRNYVGSISSSDSPVLIVGLNRELEFKAGAVWPYRRTVIEMPGPRKREAPEEQEPPSPGSAAGRLDAAESRSADFWPHRCWPAWQPACSWCCSSPGATRFRWRGCFVPRPRPPISAISA